MSIRIVLICLVAHLAVELVYPVCLNKKKIIKEGEWLAPVANCLNCTCVNHDQVVCYLLTDSPTCNQTIFMAYLKSASKFEKDV